MFIVFLIELRLKILFIFIGFDIIILIIIYVYKSYYCILFLVEIYRIVGFGIGRNYFGSCLVKVCKDEVIMFNLWF